MPASAVILAAGLSVRMGAPKAKLYFDENQTFAQKLAAEYHRAGIEQLILVVNRDLYEDIAFREGHRPQMEVVLNPFPEKGRHYSLLLGLAQVPKGHACFFQNVDNPFTDASLLRSLWPYCQDQAVIVPEFEGKGGHPVLLGHDVVRTICTKPLPSFWRIDRVLENFGQHRVAVYNKLIHCNINSPEDYKEAGFSAKL